MHRLLAAFALLLSGAFVAALPAGASPTVTHTSISGPTFDFCTGELVNLDLQFTSVTDFFTDATGGLHVLAHQNASGSGVGATTGNVYRSQSGFNETDEAFTDGVAESFSITSTFQLVGQGSASDLRAHTTFHFAIVDGAVIASVSNISLDCG